MIDQPRPHRFWATNEQLVNLLYSVVGISPFESTDPEDTRTYPIPDGEEILRQIWNQPCTEHRSVSIAEKMLEKKIVELEDEFRCGESFIPISDVVKFLKELRAQEQKETTEKKYEYTNPNDCDNKYYIDVPSKGACGVWRGLCVKYRNSGSAGIYNEILLANSEPR